MTVITRPSMTDDSGVLTDGTIVNKAFEDAIMAETDDQCHSSTNTTIKPKATTDEVVTARGTAATLAARLTVALEDNGDLKIQSSLVTTAQAGALPLTNVVLNETFLIWAAGDAAAASGWTLAGTGAAVVRAGTGESDTRRKVGDFCSKLTFGSATLTYYNEVLATSQYSRLDHLDGTKLTFGAWVWASAASQSRIYVADGVTTSYSTAYHAGGSTWEFLSGTHTFSGSATYLRTGISVENGAANPAYYSGVTLMFGDVVPTDWRPTPNILSTIAFDSLGTIAVLTDKHRYVFRRMALIKDVQVTFKTAPTGAAAQLDLNNGADTMCTTKILVDATDKGGIQEIDGTYEHRCFGGERLDAPLQLLTVDVDVVGSTLTGADMTVMVRFLEYVDPFESVKNV